MSADILRRDNVKVSGRGTRPMLFAHGSGCDQNMRRFVAPAFEEDYRVVPFDYVGSGKSDPRAYDPARYSTLDGHARDVPDGCEAPRLRDVVFVGHSVSSVVGPPASIEEPRRFSRVVLVGPRPATSTTRPATAAAPSAPTSGDRWS